MASFKSPLEPNGKTVRWPVWIGIAFTLIIAACWLLQAPSREEAFGDTGKHWDILRGAIGGWTPNYMLGHSLMTLQISGWGDLPDSCLGNFAWTRDRGAFIP